MQKIVIFFIALCVAPHCLCAQQTNETLTTAIQRYLQRAAANGYHGSVLVAQGGQVLVEKGYGMADQAQNRLQTAQTVFSVGSITKQFTGAAVLKLWEQGKIRLDAPLSTYFPEAPADKAAITVHQLLTHTAGFPDALGDDYDNVDAPTFLQLAFKAPLENAPGTVYQYSNVGYSILGILVEKTSGMGYEPFLREHLWKPAGMEQTGYLLPQHRPDQLAVGYRDGERWGTALDHPWLPDGPGWHLRANGGVLSTVGDMFRWYKALKNNIVLSKPATDLFFKPHTAEGPRGISFYGYGWVVQDMEGSRTIWHNGGNGVYNAFMGFDLAADRCIIVSSNTNNKISDDLAQQIQRIIVNGGQTLAEGTPQRFDGRYRLPSGATFEVKLDENDNLVTLMTDREPLLLLLSDGSEKPAMTDPISKRTRLMLEGIQKGDYTLIAKYRDIPLEMALKRVKPFWEDMQAERGRIAKVEVLGTVARQKAGLMLTFVRVGFAQKPLYFMYVWRGEQIDDVREFPILDKTFAWQKDLEFYAANNDLRVILENPEKGTPTLLVRSPKGDVRAVRE